MMSLMSATLSPPPTPKSRWSIAEIKRNMLCGICQIGKLNSWGSCLRRSSLLNCHMGFMSRGRQMFFMVIQVCKFLPIPRSHHNQFPRFKGNVSFGARFVQDETNNPTIPRHVHNAMIAIYGKNYSLFVKNIYE